MGDDLAVVNAARVSFDKESEWEKGEAYEDFDYYEHEYVTRHLDKLSEKDQKLISYLAKHNHWTPFSHVQLTMRETVPIFVARQRFKHMVGFTYNEVSRRYVDDTPELFEPEYWRVAVENKKQGSANEKHPHSDDWDEIVNAHLAPIISLYESMIDDGVPAEQARMILPQSIYTSYYCTGSLAAWARAYKLRSDPHAQKEIQDLAAQWNDIISNLPELKYSWTALTSNA